MLLGTGYIVGSLEIEKEGDNLFIYREYDEYLEEEDMEISSDVLYLYTSKPTLEQLQSHSGKRISYGEAVSIGKAETVWIQAEMEMSFLIDDVLDLDVYDYSNSQVYRNYQIQ